MKIKILLLLIVLCTISTQAQITKSEAYILGTKLAFYPNECGNTIPEAAGKLTFCDKNSSLGIVEESYGLNNRNIRFMLDNRANADEAFVTNEGLSIKKIDGTYENIPNIAIPDFNTSSQWQNNNIFRGGLVMPNNNVIFSSGDPVLNIYNRANKTITTTPFSEFRTPILYAFDEDRNLAWIVAREGSFELHLYNYSITNGLVYSGQLSSSINASQLASSALNSPTLTYKDDYLFFGNQNGLHKINVEDLVLTVYNTSSTQNLPFDAVDDLKFDTDGFLWLAANGSSDGAIIKFDVDNETFEQYQLASSTNVAINYEFANLAIDDTGTIWTSALNYSGIIKLEFDAGNPQWEQLSLNDIEQLGVTLLYTPDNIYFRNNKTYFTTFAASSGSLSTVDEIAIYNNNNWSSITDNELDNISYLSNRRFTYNLPDNQGGIWWFNTLDDIIVYRDANDEQFVFTEFESISDHAAIDIDGKPITRLGFPNGSLQKIETPIAYDLSNAANQNVNGLARYKDQIWWYNESNLSLNVIEYNQTITSFDLDTSYDGAFNFEMDSNGNAWFAKSSGSLGTTRIIKKFDPTSQTTTDYTFENTSFPISEIISAVNGTMWFIAANEIIYYDGINFSNYIFNDTPELYNAKAIAVDDFNNAYVLLNDPAAIVKIENAGTQEVTFSTTAIEGINSVLPALGHYRPSDLSIDSEGAIWTNASQNTFKLIDDDITPENINEGETFTFSGLIYNDINENNVFDAGEEYSGQLVALKINGTVYTTFSNANGIYTFYLYEENTDYEIILPILDQYVTAEDRQLIVAVGDNEQNYNNNDFQLKPRFSNSLLVKSSSKQGAWGFDRFGFKNNYTTAIGNISESETFNDVNIVYTFKNEDENSTNIIPNIDEVRVFELDPNGNIQLIQNVTIYPRDNGWFVDLDPSAFTQNQLAITPNLTVTGSQTDISIVIPTVSPLNTYIIDIETALYDPSQAGTIITHGMSSIASNDFIDVNDNPINTPIILFPNEDRNDSQSGFDISSDDSIYIDPSAIYVDPPNTVAKQIYGPGAFKTRIFSSYDPNDKLVDEGVSGEINDRNIEHKWLTYTIQFENTGNFSAKDVVITDILDENLDPNSVTVIEASDNYTVEIIKNGNDESILKFNFNDIFLPFDDANNDGYIKFMVKANESILENTIVNNTANIYFDQNPAITTNTIQNRFLTIATLNVTDEILEAQFKIFPNPTNSIVNISSKVPIKNIEIFNILGKNVFETNTTTVNVSHLATGAYILKISSEKGIINKKLIIN